MLSKHSILECITQISLKSKSTTIITSSSEQHSECLLARQSSREGCYFPLPSSGSFSVSQSPYSSPRVWGFEVSLLRLCHCQIVLTGHHCQLLEDKDLWLPLSSAFPWPSAPPASVCSATSPHRILFSAVGLGKFVTSISSISSSSCSVSQLLSMPLSIPMALKLCLFAPKQSLGCLRKLWTIFQNWNNVLPIIIQKSHRHRDSLSNRNSIRLKKKSHSCYVLLLIRGRPSPESFVSSNITQNFLCL